MNKKSKTLRLFMGVCLLYFGIDYIRYGWIGVPLIVVGVLFVIGYIRQMRKKEED